MRGSPFENGEVRVPRGTFPKESRLEDGEGISEKESFERREVSPRPFGDSPVQNALTTTELVDLTDERYRSPKPIIHSSPLEPDNRSPTFTETSTTDETPRAMPTARRARKSTSMTPTPMQRQDIVSPKTTGLSQHLRIVITGILDDEDDPDDHDDDEQWGDEGMMHWEAGSGNDTADEEISSVATGDVGMSEEETWGEGAVLNYVTSGEEDEDGTEGDAFELLETGATEQALTVEDLRAKGMPDYSTWTLPKLQVSSWLF